MVGLHDDVHQHDNEMHPQQQRSLHQNTFLNPQIYTSIPGAENRRVNGHRLLSASFPPTCSYRCWTLVPRGKEMSTDQRLVASNSRIEYLARLKRARLGVLPNKVGSLVNKYVRKTFANNRPSLFRELPECASDAEE